MSELIGNVCNILGELNEAAAAYNPAIELDPKLAYLNMSLAGCYRKLGLENGYNKHIQIARDQVANEDEYNRACFEAICGNTHEALKLLRMACEKKEVGIEWARCDPDFDWIRDDLRFTALLDEMARQNA